MTQDVSDSGDFPPWDVRFGCLGIGRQSTACFGDDLKVAFDQLMDASVGGERREVQSGGIGFNIRNGSEYVLDINSGVRRGIMRTRFRLRLESCRGASA